MGLMEKTVALAASRKTEEMTALVEKQGGQAVVRPLQGTTFDALDDIKNDVEQIINEKETDWFIFTTGVGAESVLGAAENEKTREALKDLLQTKNVAVRGYKTYNTLKKIDVSPVIRDEDGTTSSLLEAMEDIDFQGKHVVIQLHGVKLPRLAKFLEEKKAASITELMPYRHLPPKEETLFQLKEELYEGALDAICFTTQMQVHSLFQFANKAGFQEELRQMLNNQTVAAAVGKVTAEALQEYGVNRIISPENQRMGAMVVTLSDYFK
ncbi:uroporphyrinogen-III synthase [Alteribacillus persepolensis]|uniref:Uroporphyrinogen-III synthase n=1 Tax=Alteribacillus persepolensis TaxID=568899 RepID=A0A1G7Z6T8_9BACI|nr:uroporphyrinogen-III synthase [Alteribacillus persepolensis]SDH04404.1 uroporphyrinogen-III synthase [Alteribacillus persepolensis]